MSYFYQVVAYVVTNAVSLGIGAGLGYWFGPAVVAYLQSLLKKIA